MKERTVIREQQTAIGKQRTVVGKRRTLDGKQRTLDGTQRTLIRKPRTLIRKQRTILGGITAVLAFILLAAGLEQPVVIVDAQGAISTLEEGIRVAQPGARVVVRTGRYEESNLVVDKPLEIVSEGRPVIASKNGEQIMTITADGVTVDGLTFTGVSTSFVDDRSAIRVEQAGDCRITNNRLEDTFFGIYLARAKGCRVEGNVFEASKKGQTRSGNGVHLWYSRDVTINNNRIRGHRDGIYLEFSSNVTTNGNESVENLRYGLHFMFSDSCDYTANRFERNKAGVAVMYSKAVTMSRNRFADNWGTSAFGLLLKDITDSYIAHNTFEQNTVGIYAESANRIEVVRNEFVENGRAVKLMANSMESVFRYNTFIANTFDVTTNSTQSFSTFEQNYWDSYQGYDLDRDGTGDVPFYPVRLFALIVEQNEPSVILMRSLFVHLLDAAERVLPTLTSKALVDTRPLMAPISKQATPKDDIPISQNDHS